MNEQRVALVTGGTGFVGSNLIQKLVSDDWTVHAIVRKNSNLQALGTCIGKIHLHEHDGSTESMMQILAESRPDVVFHLASLFLSDHASKDVSQLIQSNVLFATQLLEAMVETNATNLVNTGTSWEHYENQAYSPVNLYAATKQAFEAVLQYYVEAKSINAITLKLFDTYGPADPRSKLFTLLRKCALSQKPLGMSPGEQLIDLLYIDDVIDAYLIAQERLQRSKIEQHEIYAVTSGHPIKLKDLVAAYSETTGNHLMIEWGARPYRAREVMTPWNVGKVLLGWEPKVSLRDGILRTESRTDTHQNQCKGESH